MFRADEGEAIGGKLPTRCRRVVSRSGAAALPPISCFCPSAPRHTDGAADLLGPVRTRASPRAASVTHPIAGPWAEAGGSISGVCELATLQRQATAADTSGQSLPQALQLCDALVNPACPPGRELGPVRSLRHPPLRQLGELRRNVVERHPNTLGEDNERNPSQDGPRIAPVS